MHIYPSLCPPVYDKVSHITEFWGFSTVRCSAQLRQQDEEDSNTEIPTTALLPHPEDTYIVVWGRCGGTESELWRLVLLFAPLRKKSNSFAYFICLRIRTCLFSRKFIKYVVRLCAHSLLSQASLTHTLSHTANTHTRIELRLFANAWN